MNKHSIVEQDDYNEEVREKLTMVLERTVNQIIKKEIDPNDLYRPIRYRVKTVESASRKMLTRNIHPWRELSDYCGLDIIPHPLKSVNCIIDILRRIESVPSNHFKIVQIEDITAKQTKSFGYRATHVDTVVREDNFDYRIEIQIRTAFADIWSVISHDAYQIARKDQYSNDLPREFHQISAMLEITENIAIGMKVKHTCSHMEIKSVDDLKTYFTNEIHFPREEVSDFEFQTLFSTLKQLNMLKDAEDIKNKYKEISKGCSDYNILKFNELKANEIFLDYLDKEERLFSNNDPSDVNFYKEKQFITDNSKIFKILKRLPKGSLLHSHIAASASYEYLVYNSTYLPNCYLYMGQNNSRIYYQSFGFFNDPPEDSNWVSLESFRKLLTKNDIGIFDKQLLKSLTLEDIGRLNYVNLWERFNSIFARLKGMVSYAPVAIGYLKHFIDESIRDNIQQIEIRIPFDIYYDLEGGRFDTDWYVQRVEELVRETRLQYNMPQFNVKLQLHKSKSSSREVVMENLISALDYVNKYPQTVTGFDLVGPEDTGHPLNYFEDQFKNISEIEKSKPRKLTYYFHAGETLLYNNTNLYDAVLLNTKRIGHGLQLTKHPLLMKIVIQRKIGVEICPISNQILQNVDNFRTHPGWDLLNMGIPISISSDDPAIYGYCRLSYDFYEVCFGWGLGIPELKRLVINSIETSSFFDENEKILAFSKWQESWDKFIKYVLSLENQPPTD
eukprot:gene2007-2470_t